MSGVNVNVSISNLPQMDRHQDDLHQSPVINQLQNTQIVKSEITQRLMKPVEPDRTNGKNVDTKNRIKIMEKNDKRKKNKNGLQKTRKKILFDNDNNFVDIQA